MVIIGVHRTRMHAIQISLPRILIIHLLAIKMRRKCGSRKIKKKKKKDYFNPCCFQFQVQKLMTFYLEAPMANAHAVLVCFRT